MTIPLSAFASLVVANLPELRHDIEERAHLPYHQVVAFRRFTQRAIDSGDLDSVRRCFSFADRLRSNADPEMCKAIDACYLEELDFSGFRGIRATCLLTPGLSLGLLEINEALERSLTSRFKRKMPLSDSGDG